ncbi:Conserved_hypothetical protein [Hexamita inflata]|uniref:Uncharacterized protein n=1 Tax=Hexamita inflata TaxID=28002 RepID=A0AA86RDX1_9EUKA|nr:Conserved hypothetical protein [Hexamita inflata]
MHTPKVDTYEYSPAKQKQYTERMVVRHIETFRAVGRASDQINRDAAGERYDHELNCKKLQRNHILTHDYFVRQLADKMIDANKVREVKEVSKNNNNRTDQKHKADISFIKDGKQQFFDIGISWDTERYFAVKQKHYQTETVNGQPITCTPIIIGKGTKQSIKQMSNNIGTNFPQNVDLKQQNNVIQLFPEQQYIISLSDGNYLVIMQKFSYVVNQQQIVLEKKQYKYQRPINTVFYQNKPLIITENYILTVDSNDNLQEFYKSRYLDEIFVLNDYLYLVKAGQIYKYNNSKFKLLDICASCQTYQFCDIVYVVENERLCAFKSDLTRNSIVDDSFEVILFCSSTIILKSDRTVQVFDMLSKTLKEGQNKFDYHFNDLLEVGAYGLKLKDMVLIDLFGLDYPQQVEDYYKNFIQQQSNALNEKQSPSKLEQCQLMHVFKPLPNFDMYLVIEDNYLYVIDQERNILSKYPVNCEIYSGFESKSPQLGQIYHYYNYQVIPCNGVLYIQIYQSVYKLQNAQLQFAFAIPNFNLEPCDQYRCCLFSVQNKLYVQNEDNQFVYTQNKLVRVQYNNTYLYQVQDRVFTCEYNYDHGTSLEIFEMVGDELEEIFQIFHVNKIIFALNGIIVVRIEHEYKIIDLTQQKITKCNNNVFEVEIGPCGLQMKNVDLYFEGYEERMKRIYEGHIYYQMQFECYMNEINKIAEFDRRFEVKLYNLECGNQELHIEQIIYVIEIKYHCMISTPQRMEINFCKLMVDNQ